MGRIVGYAPDPIEEPKAAKPAEPTKVELAETAAGLGIEIPPKATKAEIADLIVGAEGGE